MTLALAVATQPGPATMNQPRLLPWSLSVLVLAACGGGSGGSGGGAPAAFELHVDTAAGSTSFVSARVAALVWEAPGGALSPNVLPTPVELPLVDPAGESAGLALRSAPPLGTVALHLVLQGGATAQQSNGSNLPVTLPGADLRIALESPWTGAATALALGHDAVPNLVVSGAGLAWTPALSARAVEQLAVNVADGVVASLDPAAGALVVMLPGYQDLAFDLAVPASAQLTGLDGQPRTREAFLAECTVGSTLAFSALRSSARGIEASSMHHRGRSRGELHLLGRIRTLDAGTSSFVLDVQGQRNASIWGAPDFAAVTVDAASAVIYTSHRSVRTSANFTDLVVGMLVKVEGSRPVADRMTAREVEIEDEPGSHRPGEIEGQVDSVDLGTDTITVVQRGDDPLLIGGVRVTSATVTVTASTLLQRKTDSGTVNTTLDTLTSVDRIWIRGEITGPSTVRAQWVRVEAR